MSKSGAFVRGKNGWALHRDATARMRALLPAENGLACSRDNPGRLRTVMVAYGRDEETRADLFNFLKCLHLQPVEWNDAVLRTGRASPYSGDIVAAAFDMAQAFLVLMTPDEEVRLRPELCRGASQASTEFQPRPNVLTEAGMALAKDEGRTILVSVGPIRAISNLDGRHVIRLNNTAQRRNDLVQRLKLAGCDPDTDGTDWIGLGNFERWK